MSCMGLKQKTLAILLVLYLLKYFLFKCYNNVYYKIYYNLGNIHSVGKEIHNIGPGFLRDRGGGGGGGVDILTIFNCYFMHAHKCRSMAKHKL